MNINILAQIVGTVSIFLLFCVKFYIAITERHFRRSGRVAILWTTLYVFFLFFLRFLTLVHIGTTDQLRIISGFSSLVPLVGVVSHLFLDRKMEEGNRL